MVSTSRGFVERHGIGPPESLCEVFESLTRKFVTGRCAFQQGPHYQFPPPPETASAHRINNPCSSRWLFLGEL